MIIKNSETIVLDPDSRATLKNFIESVSGQRVLEALSALCPAILRTGTIDDKVMSAGAHAGYEEAIENLMRFIEKPAEETVAKERFPSLDDDAAWAEQKEKI